MLKDSKMLGMLIQISVASLLFIMIVHHLINYFIDLLTYPKEKEDFQFIHTTSPKNQITIGDEVDLVVDVEKGTDSTDIHLLPISNDTQNVMKEELAHFLQNREPITPIPLPSIEESNNQMLSNNVL